MDNLGGAHCAVHTDVAAVETCRRCGGFVCTECLEVTLDGSVLCQRCMRRGNKASSRAVWSLVLGILGFQCGLLPGILALVLASAELAAIERGEAPAAGRNLARGGQVLGIISLVLLVVLLAAVGFFFLVPFGDLSQN